MDIQFKAADDSAYTEELIRSNMAPYYQSRKLVWDHSRFIAHWHEFDNFEVFYKNQRIGVVRFTSNDSTLFIRDIHLEKHFQSRGIGSECIDLIIKDARQRKFTEVLLRVFSENPATGLYRLKGFIQAADIDGLIEMKLQLSDKLP